VLFPLGLLARVQPSRAAVALLMQESCGELGSFIGKKGAGAISAPAPFFVADVPDLEVEL